MEMMENERGILQSRVTACDLKLGYHVRRKTTNSGIYWEIMDLNADPKKTVINLDS
jgi:hypothetical protein